MKKLLLWLPLLAVAAAPLVVADALENVYKAPEFAFTVPGKGEQLLSQYRGKVIALEFIFTTCPHCQAASRMMTRFQSEYGPRGLQVIDVAVNQNADLMVENFAREFQVNFPVGWATAEQMQKFMGFDPSGRYVVPQLVLLDRKGFVHWRTPAVEDEKWDTLMKEENIREHIEELLQQPHAAAAHRSPGTTKLESGKKPS